MVTNIGYPQTCKPSPVCGAQFKEMESLISARFAALEEQMKEGRDELARKLDEVRSTVEEVKRIVDPVGNPAQARRVSRFKGNADALSSPIQRIRLAETHLDAIAQALNQKTGRNERKGELQSV